MLKALNHFSFWVDENFILPTDMEDFKKNTILIWENAFRAKYRHIENKISSGIPVSDLEDEINSSGIELVDYLRKQDLSIPGFPAIGIELSNGYYYVLANRLEIGFHLDWKNRYKNNNAIDKIK